MMVRLRDETNTALVRYFRRRRRLFVGVMAGLSIGLFYLAFVIVPWLRAGF